MKVMGGERLEGMNSLLSERGLLAPDAVRLLIPTSGRSSPSDAHGRFDCL